MKCHCFRSVCSISQCALCLHSGRSLLPGGVNRGVHSRHQPNYKIHDYGEYNDLCSKL